MARGDETEPYDLIVIGKGSAAAYFLETVPRRYTSLRDDAAALPLTILVIGEDDNWTARGYTPGAYGQNINQAQSVVAHRTGSTAPTSLGPQDRTDWASQNAAILRELANEVVDATVTEVRAVGKQAHTTRQKFAVAANNGKTYFGYKVVIATGVGIAAAGKGHADYHEMSAEVKAVEGSPNVMNLDRFIRLTQDAKVRGALPKARIGILGWTAGTDAVMQVGTLKVPKDNLYWLMRTKPNEGGYLNVYPGEDEQERASIERIKRDSANRIVAYKDKTLKLSTVGNKIHVECELVAESRVKERAFDVDYFVYATGANPANTLTAPNAPIDDATKQARKIISGELVAQLEPVYDINQRVGEESSAPWQHVTAVQLGGTTSDGGLLIIGAAAFQMTKDMPHKFLQYEYTKLLDYLRQYPGFESTAFQEFPELLESGTTLADVPRPTVKMCKTKEAHFLTAWQKHLRENLQGYVILELIEVGKVQEGVEKVLKASRHLCYLFRQRAQAAAYLYPYVAPGSSPEQVKQRTDPFTVQAMLNPVHTMPKALHDCRLLAAIGANVGALNASSPKAMTKKTDLNELDFQVNFLEGKTELRTYISAHYPNIAETAAETFLTKVATARKTKGNMGFALYEIVDYELELERLEKQGQKAAKRATRF